MKIVKTLLRGLSVPPKNFIPLVAAGLLASALMGHAASETWSSTATGNWSTTTNWFSGTAADGAGNTAFFNAVNLTGAVTVHLDTLRTIGNLTFGDTTAPTFGYTIDNNGNSANVLTLAGGTPTITVAASNTAAISASIAGTAGLTKGNVAGVLVLTGSNSYSGTTSLSGGNVGYLQTSANNSLGSSTLFINSGNGGFRYGAAFNDLRDISFGSSGGRIDTNGLNVTYNSTFSGSIALNSSLIKIGTGTLTLAGTNNITGQGGVSVLQGTVQIDSNARLGGGTGPLSLNGGGLRYGAAFNDLRAITLGNSDGTIDTNGFSVSYSQAITGIANQDITKIGTGTFRMTTGQSYLGATNVNAGTLLINGNNSAATGAVTVAAAGTLGGVGTVGGATTINGTISPGDGAGVGTLSFAGNLTLNNNSVFTFQGGDLIDVNGTLDLNDNWTLSLTGGLVNGGSILLFTYDILAASPDLVPTFDISQLGFTPSGPLTLTNDGLGNIFLNGVQAVPEPTSALLAMAGLGLLALRRRRRA